MSNSTEIRSKFPDRGNNVVLIGMPASGKSTVGVVLAKMTGLAFLDTDLAIQHREGCRLEEIIRRKGLDEFLRIEEEVCMDLSVSGTVIATGGSVVYGEKAMEHLKQLGTIVYLETGLDALSRRLGDVRRRGVVLKEGQSLGDLLQERLPLYRKYADLTVREEGLSLEETAEAVYRLTASDLC